jgi:hypothetical protein
MKKFILLAGCAALAACSQEDAAPAENAGTNVAAAEAPAPVPVAFQLNETSWTFTRDGQAQQESIDASGNYIVNAGDKHVDHGTAVMKDGKACFTSAMDQEGEVCWSSTQMEAGEAVEVGQSMEATSDKGEKLTVTRVAYAPLSMP